jgi:hypothetical protein
LHGVLPPKPSYESSLAQASPAYRYSMTIFGAARALPFSSFALICAAMSR